jgi:hypothetical protein
MWTSPPRSHSQTGAVSRCAPRGTSTAGDVEAGFTQVIEFSASPIQSIIQRDPGRHVRKSSRGEKRNENKGQYRGEQAEAFYARPTSNRYPDSVRDVKVSDRSQPQLTFDLSRRESAGSDSPDRPVRSVFSIPAARTRTCKSNLNAQAGKT